MREKVFRNSSGSSLHLMLVLLSGRLCSLNLYLTRRLAAGFIVSPISVIVNYNRRTTITSNHVDNVLSVTSNVKSDGACFTCRKKV